MKQGIIIATHRNFKPWLVNFIKTYDHKYDLLFVFNTDESNRYDPQAVIAGIESNYDEFLVLHDTMEIKDNSLFDIIFEEHKGKSVYFRQHSCMFLAKFTKTDLSKLPADTIKRLYDIVDKNGAVKEEGAFNVEYMAVSNPVYLFNELSDSGEREQKFGRKNMVLENQYIKKYKGAWNMELVEKSKTYIPTWEE